tara:strand:- start:525 stop:671 length:147 start_codon:yes stop_codon:yes gene_type:complete
MEKEYYIIKIPKNMLNDTIEFYDSDGLFSSFYTVEELAEIINDYIEEN